MGDVIGKIVRLQVQRDPIKKRGEGYLPDLIESVPSAAIDAWGMVGRSAGRWIVDAHHKSHPESRAGGRRALSIGFTGHYDEMAARFGSAPLGIAGENILIDGPGLWLDDLGEGVEIHTAAGATVTLERPRVAAPCAEFTSFMLGLDSVAPIAEIEDSLAALHDGRRGFIVAADHTPKPVTIAVGDEVRLI